MSNPLIPAWSRRKLLVSGATISAAGLALLAGSAHAERGSGANPQDIDVLNGILGTEHEGIAAYSIFMDHGLINKDMKPIVKSIRSQHREHRDFLAKKIRELGGSPVGAKSDKAYEADLEIPKLKSQDDTFKLAMTLERGAANAYIGMLPSTNDRELAKIAGRIAADEVMHWTALSTLLHQALPDHALTFGA
jgi:rubrerythrin